jgi:hypothetical membrane protein
MSTDERTRSLLASGIVVGPFYLALGVGQGLLREGFDFRRHALSHLANGPYGWVQSANFIVSGLMVIAAAVGIARAGGREFRWPSRLLGAYGSAVFLAGFFRADPVPGFPPGTPETAASAMTTRGLLHFAFGGLGFVALAICCLLAARAFGRRGQTTARSLSAAAGIVVVAGFFGPAYLPSMSAALAALWIGVVAGWIWLTVTSAYFYRTATIVT